MQNCYASKLREEYQFKEINDEQNLGKNNTFTLYKENFKNVDVLKDNILHKLTDLALNKALDSSIQ